MTWTARFTVQDVSDGPAPIDVLATVTAEDTYDFEMPARDGNPASVTTYPSLISNTEGQIVAAELKLQLGQDQTSLKVGDVIQVTGHFQG